MPVSNDENYSYICTAVVCSEYLLQQIANIVGCVTK